MHQRYFGLDFLRGLGVAFVIALHSAFYRFDGLYDLDLDNPPAIVTVIGLLLMFAGLFAMLSGAAHGSRTIKLLEAGISRAVIARRFFVYGMVTLAVAYAYFLFTGPGIVNFATRSMDSSLVVSLIESGSFPGWSVDRLLYVDSLVMIALNLFVMALFFPLVRKPPRFITWCWLALFALSAFRIPLFSAYQTAREAGNMPLVLALNWVVGKNNPLLPYVAFAAAGMWIAALLRHRDGATLVRNLLPAGLALLITGVAAYVFLPDTMLERGIDWKWYSVMTAQLGLFLLMILAALARWDMGKKRKPSAISIFIARFGVAGLTPFFLESVVSIAVFKAIRLVIPGFRLDIAGALAYGFVLMILWGCLLALWEKTGYRYGIEYWIAKATGSVVRENRAAGRSGADE